MPLSGQIENKWWKRAWCDPDRTLACVHSNQSFFAQTSLLAVSIFVPLHFRVNLRAPECTGKVRASDASEDRWLVFGEIGRRLLFLCWVIRRWRWSSTSITLEPPCFFPLYWRRLSLIYLSISLCSMVWYPPNSLPLGIFAFVKIGTLNLNI